MDMEDHIIMLVLGSCQHCYKDVGMIEFYCPHCDYLVCESCYEVACGEIHEDEYIGDKCPDCWRKVR